MVTNLAYKYYIICSLEQFFTVEYKIVYRVDEQVKSARSTSTITGRRPPMAHFLRIESEHAQRHTLETRSNKIAMGKNI